MQRQFVLVSPDAGGAKRVLKMAQKMELNSVLIHKHRDHSKKNYVDKTVIIGEEGCLKGKHVLLLTIWLIRYACDELVKNGANDVIVCITHGILSGPAIERFNNCSTISQLVIRFKSLMYQNY